MLFGGQSSSAQTTDQYLQGAGDFAALYQGRIEPGFPLQAWNTHPYWFDREFTTADICFDGVLYHDVMIRYDVYRNLLAVRTPVRGLSIVPDADRVDYFILGGRRFIPIDGRYCCVLHEGEHAALVHRRIKTQGGDIIVSSHTLHNLFTTDDYFLLLPDGSLHRLKNVKSLTALYPQFKQPLRSNSRKLRHKYNDEAIASSLIDDVKMLDQLLADAPLLGNVARREPIGRAITPACQLAPDTIFSDAPVDIRSYHAYQQSGKPQYDAEEEYVEPEFVSDLIPLREDHILDEIIVRGFQQKVGASQVGMEKFRPAQLRNIPLALGEADVMKMVQTLPGVKTMGEASSGFNVRGGAADQNLILLNGNTVFNPMHLFGIFSAFNSDMIGETELYKSSVPTQYGGRISSVMDIHSRYADRKEWHGSFSIGALTSRASLEVPLVPGRASLLVGGRTTYSDWMLSLIPKKSGYRDGKAGFWDASATLSVSATDNHRINAYFYTSQDRFSFSPNDKYGYRNLNGSIEWKGRYNSAIHSSLSVGMDHYDYFNENSEAPYEAARLSYSINQYFLRSSVNILVADRHQLQAGIQSQLYQVAPGKYEPIGQESLIAASRLDNDKALESAIYIEDEWQATDKLKLTGGLRYTLFNAMREGKTHIYHAPEVRLSASYMLAENQSLKGGFSTMHQFIHKVSNTSIMSPTDTWTLSNARIKPQNGWQLAAGYYYQTPNAHYEINVEAYYKQMDNYLTYRSAGQLLMNPDLENDVIGTQGRAYGVELQFKKDVGKLTGWISYSYARTELRQRDGSGLTAINGGRWFPAEYDRPHEVKLVSNFAITHRYSFSMNADYSTGHAMTIPAGQYYNFLQHRFLPFYTERNGYRLPDYFRIDASFNIEPSHHLTNLTHSWFSIGCYNVLGRKNAYSVYYISENGRIQGYKLSIFGAPIPFISYNIKF